MAAKFTSTKWRVFAENSFLFLFYVFRRSILSPARTTRQVRALSKSNSFKAAEEIWKFFNFENASAKSTYKNIEMLQQKKVLQKQRISSVDSLGQKMSGAFINCNYKAISKHKVGY